MKRILIAILMCMMIAGCSTDNDGNMALSENHIVIKQQEQKSKIDEIMDDKGVAAVILSNDALDIDVDATLYLDLGVEQCEENFTLLLSERCTQFRIYAVKYSEEKQDVEKEQLIYENNNKEKRIVAQKIFTERPEGIPRFLIEIEIDNQVITYPIVFNGKDGIQDIEIIRK